MATVVSTHDGGRWRVGRRWVPWRFRRRRRSTSLDGVELPLDIASIADGPFVVIGVVAVIVLFAFTVVPMVLALIEISILVLLVAAGVLARVLLRRPWIVDVERLDAPGRTSWKVVGLRRSGELITALATQLQSGQPMTGLPDATRC